MLNGAGRFRDREQEALLEAQKVSQPVKSAHRVVVFSMILLLSCFRMTCMVRFCFSILFTFSFSPLFIYLLIHFFFRALLVFPQV